MSSFLLTDLEQYAKDGFSPDESPNHHLFYVGKDDVHGVLLHLFGMAKLRMIFNMFGYDDDELNKLVMAAILNPDIYTLVTLDKSQAGGVHERQILASDVAQNDQAFGAHVVIGTSATNQISHTKGGVIDGIAGFEGSTNWSQSGEGTFVVDGQAGGPGYKAQNNTLMVFSDPGTIRKFETELIEEHQAATAHGKILSGTPMLPH